MYEPVAGVPVAFINVADRERGLAFYRGVLGQVRIRCLVGTLTISTPR